MPKGTPEELERAAKVEADKKALKDKIDRLYNHEYETDPEIAEIKKRVAGITTDEISADSLEKLAADVDAACKRIDEMAEEIKQARASGIPAEDETDPVKTAHLGQVFAEMKELTQFGDKGPIIQALGGENVKTLGIRLPKHLESLFDGKPKSVQKTTGYLEEGQGSMGGFTVAEAFEPTLFSYQLLPPIVRGRAYTIRGTSPIINVPRINESTRSSTVFGGVSGAWTAEGGSISLSNPAFGQCRLEAKKLALLTYASNELLADNAVGLNDVLIRLFSEALMWFEDKAFINGSGVNEPLGIRNAACKKSSTATTASVFGIADACILLSESMPGSEGAPGTVWLMHPSMRRELPAMVSSSGGNNIWYNALSVKTSPAPWTLFGIPIMWTEFCAARGTDEDVILADLSYYLLLERQAIRAAISTDARFANDETGYRLTLRSDGQPWPSSALTLADGSAQVSPFVANNHT